MYIELFIQNTENDLKFVLILLYLINMYFSYNNLKTIVNDVISFQNRYNVNHNNYYCHSHAGFKFRFFT